MKNFDHIFTAIGIETDFWMDAQSEPEVLSSTTSNELTLKILCWQNGKEDPKFEAIEATYYLKIIFKNLVGYQILYSELPHYNLYYGNYSNPPFIFEVNHEAFDLSKLMDRGNDSWYPKVAKRQDNANWFSQMDKWKPYDRRVDLPNGSKHFIVSGHDTFIEILAANFMIQKVSNN